MIHAVSIRIILLLLLLLLRLVPAIVARGVKHRQLSTQWPRDRFRVHGQYVKDVKSWSVPSRAFNQGPSCAKAIHSTVNTCRLTSQTPRYLSTVHSATIAKETRAFGVSCYLCFSHQQKMIFSLYWTVKILRTWTRKQISGT